MEFNYVITSSVNVSDDNFEAMIKLLRSNCYNDYRDVIYEVLEDIYEVDAIAEVEDEIIEELKKRDSKDKEQGNIYLNYEACNFIVNFFDLINNLVKKMDGKKSRSEIIEQLFIIYKTNKDIFKDTDFDEIVKIKF